MDGVNTRHRQENTCSSTARNGSHNRSLWAEVRKETGRGKDRFTIRDLSADERCTSPILGFLRTTKVGSRVGPRAGVIPVPGEDIEEESGSVEVVEELGDGKGEG